VTLESKRNKIAMVSNPHSRRNRKGLAKVDKIAQKLGVPHYIPPTLACLEEVLREIAAKRVDILVINGGDGTLSKIISLARNKKMFVREPAIALLAGGTTNLVYRDVGVRGNVGKALLKIVLAANKSHLKNQYVERRVMVCQMHSMQDPAYGFFLGVGAIARITRFMSERVHRYKLVGPLSECLVIGAVFFRLLRGKINGSRLLAPSLVACHVEGGNALATEWVAGYMSTLKKLILTIRPVCSENGIGVFALMWPYSRIISTLCKLLFSRGMQASTTKDLFSVSTPRVTLQGNMVWVVDGEHYALQGNETLTVAAADVAVRFLVA
jgi:diacylglycerol kinase (ATP)